MGNVFAGSIDSSSGLRKNGVYDLSLRDNGVQGLLPMVDRLLATFRRDT